MSSRFCSAPGLTALSITITITLAAPAFAGFVGVSRCNASDDPHTPAMHINQGGERFIVPIGDHGLTREMIFDRGAALAWAAASGLFPEGSVFGNYEDHICGYEIEEVELLPAQPPQARDEPADVEDQEQQDLPEDGSLDLCGGSLCDS